MKENRKLSLVIAALLFTILFFLSRLIESNTLRMDIAIPLMYVLIGIAASVLFSALFEIRLKKLHMLIDSIAGTIGAFIFGIYESFARDEVRFSNYITAFIGASIAVWVSRAVRKSLEKNKVEVSDGKSRARRRLTIFNRGFASGVIAWVASSFIIGALITIRSTDAFLELFEGNLVLEYLRISLTNLAYEAVFWIPVIIVAGGISRKHGSDPAAAFVAKAFLISLVLWGGLMWYITGA